tara:strand:+ start:34 stop:303 length:270 start_codon:yes stop_codon:yes gene_type:complete
MTDPGAAINAAKWVASSALALAGFAAAQVETVPGEIIQGGALAILAGVIWQLLHLHSQQAKDQAEVLRELHREIAVQSEILRRIVEAKK